MGKENDNMVTVEGTLYQYNDGDINKVTEGFLFKEVGWPSKKLS